MINYKMGVHLFHVVQLDGAPPLAHLLETVRLDTLPNRLKNVANGQIRLEHIAPPNTESNPTRFWLLDFTKLRFEHGPGKAGRSSPIEGFDLTDDEGFGEETAALYDPQSCYMIVQYNHHGVRAGAIEEYLSAYVHDAQRVVAYQLRIKLDDTADVRLAQKQLLKKIHFKVAPAQITTAHRNSNVGLGRALDFNDGYAGDDLEIIISAKRGRFLNFSSSTRLINKLKNLVTIGEANADPIVSKFEVSGKTDAAARTDAINMLSPKLEVTVDQLQLGTDRRYTLISRWEAVKRARNGWSAFIPH
jgi:hypothetical protein